MPKLWNVADCSGYRTDGFVRISDAVRNYSNETKAISGILKIIRRKS